MTTKRLLRGYELRCVLTLHLFQNGKTTVADLVDILEYHGFEVSGRASKTMSDALRYEIAHGRVRRARRGRYGRRRCRAPPSTGSTSGPWRCERRRRLCSIRRTTHSGTCCSDWNSARTLAEHGVDMSVCA